MWPFGDEFLNDFIDFLQFFHQVVLRLQAPGGIYNENIASSCRCRLDSIIDHCARIGARVLTDDRHANAVRPYLELIDGRRAEAVTYKHMTLPTNREAV